MRQAFQAFLTLLGVIVIAISLAHMAIGPRAVVGGVAVNRTMAGEDRFFAGLFLCCGIAPLWCARNVQRKRVYVNLLAAAFFVGGIGRLLAVALDGAPHSFDAAMLVLELALPPLMVVVAKQPSRPRNPLRRQMARAGIPTLRIGSARGRRTTGPASAAALPTTVFAKSVHSATS